MRKAGRWDFQKFHRPVSVNNGQPGTRRDVADYWFQLKNCMNGMPCGCALYELERKEK